METRNAIYIELCFENLTLEEFNWLEEKVYTADGDGTHLSEGGDKEMVFELSISGQALTFFQLNQPSDALFISLSQRFPAAKFSAICIRAIDNLQICYYQFQEGALYKFYASEKYHSECAISELAGRDKPSIIGYQDLNCIELHRHQFVNKYTCLGCGQSWQDISFSIQEDVCSECEKTIMPISSEIVSVYKNIN